MCSPLDRGGHRVSGIFLGSQVRVEVSQVSGQGGGFSGLGSRQKLLGSQVKAETSRVSGQGRNFLGLGVGFSP
jgi:hypothetical protein